VSARGVLPLAPSFDVVGLCSRSGALLLDALLVIAGVADSPEIDELLLAQDVLSTVEGGEEVARTAREIARLRELRVSEVSFSDFASDAAADLLSRLQGAEIWREHGAWVAANLSFLDEDVAARLERCRALAVRPDEEEERDRRERARYAGAFAQLVGETRAVVLPVLPCPMPLRTAGPAELRRFRALTLRLTAPASLAGAPEAVLPAGAAGLGILGPRGSDLALARLASGHEAVGEVRAR
jgi:amidase